MSKLAIGLIAAAAIVAAVVVGVVVTSGGDDATSAGPATSSETGGVEQTAQDSEPGDGPSGEATPGTDSSNDGADGSDQVEAPTFADGPTAEAVRDIAPDYDADGDGAVECIEQNTVGGFTDEELRIIAENPNAATWPPGLGEKFAAVLEECIPLEPFYLAQFSMFSWQDNACIGIMTDYVLTAYSWAIFIVRGVLDEKERPALQAEFDLYVSNGYAAKNCYSQ